MKLKLYRTQRSKRTCRIQNVPETQIVSETQEETRNAPAKKIVTKTHEKKIVARSQLQAISQLASGVNRLADFNAKRMKLKEKDRKPLSEFRKEEAEKNQQHEKEMPQSPYE